jgi:hypothetical protein
MIEGVQSQCSDSVSLTAIIIASIINSSDHQQHQLCVRYTAAADSKYTTVEVVIALTSIDFKLQDVLCMSH